MSARTSSPRVPARASGSQPSPADNSRKRLMIAIRAACRRLGIDDDDRKALQLERTGKHSMSDMSVAELGALLTHLNVNWKTPDRPVTGKVRALWWSLYWLGAIDRPDDEALGAFVKRQTGIAALRFLDHRQAPAVIEALKSWLAREGIHWLADPDPTGMADRHAVLTAIGHRLREAGDLTQDSIYPLALARVGRQNYERMAMTAPEVDACIRHFGKQLRRHVETGRDVL